jgi:hypothetical protein
MGGGNDQHLRYLEVYFGTFGMNMAYGWPDMHTSASGPLFHVSPLGWMPDISDCRGKEALRHVFYATNNIFESI